MNALTDFWSSFQGAFPAALRFFADALSFLGGHRWAAAIFVMTIVVNTAFLPLAIKQVKAQRAMARVQPEMKRIQQKYRNDRQRQSQEMTELWRREGANPLAGCLPILVQLPIFFAMFYAVRDVKVDRMPFLGLGNLADPSSSSAAGWLLLVVMVTTQFLAARQIPAMGNPAQQKLFQYMPILFVLFFINYPAALVLYWATQGLFRYVQQYIMLRVHPLPPVSGAAKPSGKRQAARGGAGPRPKAKQRADGKRRQGADGKRRQR